MTGNIGAPTRSLAGRLQRLVVVSLVSMGLVFAAASYALTMRQVVDLLGLVLEHVAATAAVHIDGDALDRVVGPDGARTPEFAAARDTLKRQQAANTGFGEDQLYVLRWVKGAEGKELEFVLMLQEKTFVGDRYTPRPDTVDLYLAVTRDGRATHTPFFYQDPHGEYVSGYAPIRRRDGSVAGILEADFPVAQFKELAIRSLLLTVLLGALAGLVGWWQSRSLARRMVEAITRLREGADRLAREVFDQEISVPQDVAELVHLASRFDDVRVRLRERVSMLKFLPEKTRELIAERAQLGGEALEQASRHARCSIMFTDIRGFTRMSAELRPDRMVHMLNMYLGRQGEVVRKHGGAVDKFIGDAVMAVFEGKHSRRSAVMAALELQDEVRKLNEARAFEREIHVGAGVSHGLVILGTVGFEGLYSLTVIGSPVNLAARLCSMAKADQVVISDRVYEALKDELEVADRAESDVKGFTDKVVSYRVLGRRDVPEDAPEGPDQD